VGKSILEKGNPEDGECSSKTVAWMQRLSGQDLHENGITKGL
jgi:hypothetical protein